MASDGIIPPPFSSISSSLEVLVEECEGSTAFFQPTRDDEAVGKLGQAEKKGPIQPRVPLSPRASLSPRGDSGAVCGVGGDVEGNGTDRDLEEVSPPLATTAPSCPQGETASHERSTGEWEHVTPTRDLRSPEHHSPRDPGIPEMATGAEDSLTSTEDSGPHLIARPPASPEKAMDHEHAVGDKGNEEDNLPVILQTEPDGFGGMRHLWSDGVWRPHGTQPHEAENVVKRAGIQYPIYLTVNPTDGKYYPIKGETDEEKRSKYGQLESVGVVFAFPPLGWQRINIGRPLYERCVAARGASVPHHLVGSAANMRSTPNACRHRVYRDAINEVNEYTMDLLPQPFVQILYPDPIDEPMCAPRIGLADVAARPTQLAHSPTPAILGMPRLSSSRSMH
eukprot:scaffold28985_cov31-Tisochrysis_lutea.AAC.1